MVTNNFLKYAPTKGKMNNYKIAIAASFAIALTGCGGMNSYLAASSQTVEIYHIFDIKTAADTATVVKAATEGLSQNTNSINAALPLQLGKVVPKEPGRFKLENISGAIGGSAGALIKMASMQGGNISMKVANCEDAVWNSQAKRTISGSSDLTLYSCLYKYKAGYQLDIYAVFQKEEGGLYQVSRDIAYKIVGTPEVWVNKTILDTVKSIEKATAAKIVHLEGQPEIGNLPWVDKVSSN